MLVVLKYIELHFFPNLTDNNNNFIDINFVFAGNDGDVFLICETNESNRTINSPVFNYFSDVLHFYFQ